MRMQLTFVHCYPTFQFENMKNSFYFCAPQCLPSDDLSSFNAIDEIANQQSGDEPGCFSVCSLSSKKLLDVFDANLQQVVEFVGILQMTEQLTVVSVRHQFEGATHDTYIPAIGSNAEKLRSIADGENKLVIFLEAEDSDGGLVIETELLPLQGHDLPVQRGHSNAELLEFIELVESLHADVSDLSRYTRCVILPEELTPLH